MTVAEGWVESSGKRSCYLYRASIPVARSWELLLCLLTDHGLGYNPGVEVVQISPIWLLTSAAIYLSGSHPVLLAMLLSRAHAGTEVVRGMFCEWR